MSCSGSNSSARGSRSNDQNDSRVSSQSSDVSNIENCHPKKSKTFDNLKNGLAGSSNDIYSDFNHSQPSTSTVTCLLCSFAHMDPRTVEEHMNSVHFDLANQSSGSDARQEPAFSCPMCPDTFSDAKALQTHVNGRHKDILSPVKVHPDVKKCESVNLCPVCNTFSSESAEEMGGHINRHFSNSDTPDTASDHLLAEQISKSTEEKRIEEKEFERLKILYGMDDKGDFKNQSTANMQKAVRSGRLTLPDYYEKQSELRSAEYRGIDDGSSCVRGVIPRIRERSVNSINVAQTYTCYNTDFYGSTFGDKGWGCGYRNIQMLLSALSRNKIYAELLSKRILSPYLNVDKRSGNFMPSISKIQEMIEWAWKEGFDAEGREQLDGKLCNTRKWIGATEVTTLLSSMRIKCELIDILRPTVVKLHYKMFDWILTYFKKTDTFKPPLYLQHDGHSRTIIGVEVLKDGDIILLILDPGIESYKIENMLTYSNPFSTMKPVRCTLSNMVSKQYQIVSVCGVINSEEEYQASKVLRSTKIQ